MPLLCLGVKARVKVNEIEGLGPLVIVVVRGRDEERWGIRKINKEFERKKNKKRWKIVMGLH